MRQQADFVAASERQRLKHLATDSVARLQLEKLREVWADAISDVPYYTQLVESGAAPKEIRNWEDFRSIPVLTRRHFQEMGHLFERRSRPAWRTIRTGGSTGEPIKLGASKSEARTLRIAKVAFWQSLGYERGSRLFLIWGHSHLLGTGLRGRLADVKRHFADWWLHYTRVNAYVMTPEDCRRYLTKMRRVRPDGLIGYASCLDLLARHVLLDPKLTNGLALKFAIATGEMAPRDDTSEAIREAFECKVGYEFGGVDFGQVAYKIDDEDYIVLTDLCIVEGESVESISGGHPMLVTCLYDRYTPLIRYRQGDRFSGLKYLPNGNVASFQQISGREHTHVELGDGTKLHTMSLLHCIHSEQEVAGIQVVLRNGGLEVRLASVSGVSDAAKLRIRHRLGQIDQTLAECTLNVTTDLETTMAGKRPWLIDKRTRK